MSDFATRAIHHLGARIVKILWPGETVLPASELSISWQLIVQWVTAIKDDRDQLEKDIQRERSMCEYAMAIANDLRDKNRMAMRVISIMRLNEIHNAEVVRNHAAEVTKLKDHARETDEIIATLRMQRDRALRAEAQARSQQDIAEKVAADARHMASWRADPANAWRADAAPVFPTGSGKAGSDG